MNPIKEVMKKAKVNQKEVSEIMKIKQSTLSKRMNKEIVGSIEQSIQIAKKLNIKRFSVNNDSYSINVTIK